MLAERSPYVSVEKVEAGISSGPTIGIGNTRVLLETWCIHELQWVVYEPKTPPVWAKSSDICAGTSGPYGCQGPSIRSETYWGSSS
jgi:hypothetical protein